MSDSSTSQKRRRAHRHEKTEPLPDEAPDRRRSQRRTGQEKLVNSPARPGERWWAIHDEAAPKSGIDQRKGKERRKA